MTMTTNETTKRVAVGKKGEDYSKNGGSEKLSYNGDCFDKKEEIHAQKANEEEELEELEELEEEVEEKCPEKEEENCADGEGKS